MPELLTAITTCNLCGSKFRAERIPIIGEDVAAKSQRVMQRLLDHLQKEHADRLVELARAAMQYNALLTLNCFTLSDPALIDAREQGRAFALSVLQPQPEPVPAVHVESNTNAGIAK